MKRQWYIGPVTAHAHLWWEPMEHPTNGDSCQYKSITSPQKWETIFVPKQPRWAYYVTMETEEFDPVQ